MGWDCSLVAVRLTATNTVIFQIRGKSPKPQGKGELAYPMWQHWIPKTLPGTGARRPR